MKGWRGRRSKCSSPTLPSVPRTWHSVGLAYFIATAQLRDLRREALDSLRSIAELLGIRGAPRSG